MSDRYKGAELDFMVTDYLQRLEVWASVARLSNNEVDVLRTAELYAGAVLVPVSGNAYQVPGTQGFDPDGFMLRRGVFRFALRKPASSVEVVGWLPPQHERDVEITAACSGFSTSAIVAPGVQFQLELPLDLSAGEHEFQIALSSGFRPASLPGSGSDTRSLGCIIQCVAFV